MDTLPVLSNFWLVSFGMTLLAFIGVWIASVRTRDVGVVDFYWGPGFAVSAWLGLAFYGTVSTGTLIFALAVTLWSVRLAIHLIARHMSAHGEDGRYAAMREAGGASFWWVSLFKIFILQAVIHWLVQFPVILVVSNDALSAAGGLFWLGMVIFAVGFLAEAVADGQLARFKRDDANKGKLLASGLWGWSRHPNYIGEIVLWVGLSLAAFALTGSWLVWVGPAVLALAMFGVSLPLTDLHLRQTKTGFDTYASRVPATLGARGTVKSVPAE